MTIRNIFEIYTRYILLLRKLFAVSKSTVAIFSYFLFKMLHSIPQNGVILKLKQSQYAQSGLKFGRTLAFSSPMSNAMSNQIRNSELTAPKKQITTRFNS